MNGTRDPKADFLTIYKDIRRPGADKLLAWLASTDFFTAPAGAKRHGAHAGGLVVHSLNVWSRLREITLRDTIDGKAILDLKGNSGSDAGNQRNRGNPGAAA